MSGVGRNASGSPSDRPDPVEEDLDEVLCENGCRDGFKVLIGQTIIVLVCLKCRLEYELTQEQRPDE